MLNKELTVEEPLYKDITLKDFRDYLNKLMEDKPELSNKNIIFPDGKEIFGLILYSWDKDNLSLIDQYSLEYEDGILEKNDELFIIN